MDIIRYVRSALQDRNDVREVLAFINENPEYTCIADNLVDARIVARLLEEGFEVRPKYMGGEFVLEFYREAE